MEKQEQKETAGIHLSPRQEAVKTLVDYRAQLKKAQKDKEFAEHAVNQAKRYLRLLNESIVDLEEEIYSSGNEAQIRKEANNA